MARSSGSARNAISRASARSAMARTSRACTRPAGLCASLSAVDLSAGLCRADEAVVAARQAQGAVRCDISARGMAFGHRFHAAVHDRSGYGCSDEGNGAADQKAVALLLENQEMHKRKYRGKDADDPGSKLSF